MAPETTAAPKTALSLPLSLVTLIDLSRLQRELEAINIFLDQSVAREPGTQPTMPRTTRNMEKMCQQNQLNLLVAADRARLAVFLKGVRDKAPRIHISFAADPSSAFIQKIVSWFRINIHPLTILQVGLQPTIAAGCVIRSTNKYFDLSLRKHFDKQRGMLTESVRQARVDARETPTQPTASVPDLTAVPAPAPLPSEVETVETSPVIAPEPPQTESGA